MLPALFSSSSFLLTHLTNTVFECFYAMEWGEENTDWRKDKCTLNKSSVGPVYTEQRKREGEEEDEGDEEGDIFMSGES